MWKTSNSLFLVWHLQEEVINLFLSNAIVFLSSSRADIFRLFNFENTVEGIPLLMGQKKNMCVYCHMSKKSRVGRSTLIFFLLSAKPEIVSFGIRFRYFIFEISDKPSFVETVLWRVTQFFYLLCSQCRQKVSGWINKTLLLIKHQKWLSEFCVKIDRVASKN
jgi:hypothetical protein